MFDSDGEYMWNVDIESDIMWTEHTLMMSDDEFDQWVREQARV